MKILSLQAENVKRLKAVTITPDGSVVQITGKNGAGKSSVLDSIFFALGGGKSLPKEPIRRGEKTARIRLDLGELIVTRKFNENGTTALTVEGATGARYSTPQRMLDELLGAISFDPLEFSRMEPKDQFDMLRKVSKLDVDLESLAGKNKTDFETRTDVNRRIKALRAQIEAIKVPEGLPDAPVDVDEILSNLTAASQTNTSIERKRTARETVQSDIVKLRGEAGRLEAEVKRMRDQADDLERQLNEAQPLGEPVNVDELRKAIDAGRTINDGLRLKQRRADLEADIAREDAEAKRLTAEIEARDAAKDAALAAAKMPVDDIALGDGIVLYKGLPFDQASSAEQLRASVAIAMATNPKLKVMLIREGGLLDEDGMNILREMVEAADYQVWIETVHANGPVSVEMVDGAAKGADVEAKATPATSQPTKEARADGSLL